MSKVKHERTADCVVGGFRWHKEGGGVGSLLLGLYDEEGALHHVGVASGFTVALRKSLEDDLAPYRLDIPGPSLAGDGAGADSTTPTGSTEPLECGQGPFLAGGFARARLRGRHDHLQGDRFRHATSFRRWRPEREPPRAPTPSSRSPCPRSSPGLRRRR